MILKNEVSTSKLPPPKIVSTLSYKNIVRDAGLMKQFIGLTPSQFEVLHNFLDAVRHVETIHYWTGKDCPTKDNARTGPKGSLRLFCIYAKIEVLGELFFSCKLPRE